MRALQTCVVVLAAASSNALAAESIGVLPVGPPPGPSSELVDLTTQLRQAMAVRSPTEVLDTRELRDRMAGKPAGASLAELDRAYEGARAAAVGGDYEGSVKTLRAIIEELEKLPDGEESFEQWTRAMMRLAKSEADLGRGDASRGILDRLLRAAPDVKVDPALYPPRFATQVEEVRSQLKALPSRRLTVSSPAKGARVFVNGRNVGNTPVTVALPAGRYRVSASLRGVVALPRQVDLVADDQTVVLDFTVPESLRPNLPGLALPDADRVGRLIAAGGYLGLDSLLATIFVEQDGVAYLQATLFDVRRGMLKREARVRLANKMLPVGATGALAEFLLTGEVTSSVVEPVTPDMRPSAPPVAKAKRKIDVSPPGSAGKPKAKGWIAFGTGIAAIGLGGVAIWQGIESGNSYDEARSMLVNGALPPNRDPRVYNALIEDGDSARRVAIVSGVGAGVCLATSAVLGYLSYKQTGEIGPFRF